MLTSVSDTEDLRMISEQGTPFGISEQGKPIGLSEQKVLNALSEAKDSVKARVNAIRRQFLMLRVFCEAVKQH